jgi:hypothetical protein
MRREDLEAIVKDVITVMPEGKLADQPEGFQRLVARWAAEESERSCGGITPEAYFARGRTDLTHEAEDTGNADDIVRAARR